MRLDSIRGQYPGNGIPATRGDIASFKEAIDVLAIPVEEIPEATPHYNVTQGKVVFDSTNVDLADLTDEYMHVWNQMIGRGRFLAEPDASLHRRLGSLAVTYGSSYFDDPVRTAAVGYDQNEVFHQLEILNFLQSRQEIPDFLKHPAIGSQGLWDFVRSMPG